MARSDGTAGGVSEPHGGSRGAAPAAAAAEWLRCALETSVDGVWIVDAEGLTSFANRRLGAIVGCEPAELLGRPMRALLAPDAPSTSDLLARWPAIRSDPLELTFRRPDGGDSRARVTLSALRDAEGRSTGAVAIVAALDGQRRGGAAAGGTDERLHAAFEEGTIGMALIAADLRLIDANARLCALLEYGRDDLIGRSLPELTHPDERERLERLAARAFRGELDRLRIEKRWRKRSGGHVAVALTATILWRRDGAPDCAVAIVEELGASRDRALLDAVEAVRDLVRVCAGCKKVRDGQGDWSELEDWIRKRAQAEVSHALCPGCARRYGWVDPPPPPPPPLTH